MADDDCERDENGNYLDVLTYNIIPPGRLIRIPMGPSEKCFDIDSLYRSFVESGNAINPFTREPLPESIIEEIKDYGVGKEVIIQLTHWSVRRPKEILAVPYYKTIGDLIVKIIAAAAKKSGTSYIPFLKYDLVGDGESIYLMNLEDNVSSIENRSIEFAHFRNSDAGRQALNRLVQYLRKNSGPEMSTNYIVHQAALQVLGTPTSRREIVIEIVIQPRISPMSADFDGDEVSI
ncbi:Hypothetical protein POVR1_LOCUS472 [uncultured virus]|nr:Hypothetical protein POVR1_LOCUS472 [uncultured virus]